MTGHVVTVPSAGPHVTLRLVTDIDLLLAHTIASVRMNRPSIVVEPPASWPRAGDVSRRTPRPGR